MNYLKHYVLLMRKAEQREAPAGYTEKHHIFPKSVYGANNRVVRLTAREHYIAHALLDKGFTKRYGMESNRTHKMIKAHMGMKGKGKSRQAYTNSYIYEGMKNRMAISMQGNTISKGNTYTLTPEQVKAKKHRLWYNNGVEQTMCAVCPPGWVSGRLPLKGNYSKPGARNSHAHKWQLHLSDGSAIIVTALKEWCRKQGDINYFTLYTAWQQNRGHKYVTTITKL